MILCLEKINTIALCMEIQGWKQQEHAGTFYTHVYEPWMGNQNSMYMVYGIVKLYHTCTCATWNISTSI